MEEDASGEEGMDCPVITADIKNAAAEAVEGQYFSVATEEHAIGLNLGSLDILHLSFVMPELPHPTVLLAAICKAGCLCGL